MNRIQKKVHILIKIVHNYSLLIDQVVITILNIIKNGLVKCLPDKVIGESSPLVLERPKRNQSVLNHKRQIQNLYFIKKFYHVTTAILTINKLPIISDPHYSLTYDSYNRKQDFRLLLDLNEKKKMKLN